MSEPNSTDLTKVVAVVVTWNRRALIEECLDAVFAQEHRPVAVVVVDNASDDETAEYLASRTDDGLNLVRLAQNTVQYQALLKGLSTRMSILATAISEGRR